MSEKSDQTIRKIIRTTVENVVRDARQKAKTNPKVKTDDKSLYDASVTKLLRTLRENERWAFGITIRSVVRQSRIFSDDDDDERPRLPGASWYRDFAYIAHVKREDGSTTPVLRGEFMLVETRQAKQQLIDYITRANAAGDRELPIYDLVERTQMQNPTWPWKRCIEELDRRGMLPDTAADAAE